MTISIVSGCMENSQTTPTIVITILTAALVAAVVVAAISTAAQNNNNSAIAQQQQQQEQNQVTYRIQETAMSMAAPVAHTGNLPHAVVFTLPIRDDGKIYTGRVMFTASKPIEVEMIHIYRPDQAPDKAHGEPPTAVINGMTITYSHLTGLWTTR
jgi:mannitol-specific phosphotransferase system IIBC component